MLIFHRSCGWAGLRFHWSQTDWETFHEDSEFGGGRWEHYQTDSEAHQWLCIRSRWRDAPQIRTDSRGRDSWGFRCSSGERSGNDPGLSLLLSKCIQCDPCNWACQDTTEGFPRLLRLFIFSSLSPPGLFCSLFRTASRWHWLGSIQYSWAPPKTSSATELLHTVHQGW